MKNGYIRSNSLTWIKQPEKGPDRWEQLRMTVRVAAYWARADLPGKGHVPFSSYCHMQ